MMTRYSQEHEIKIIEGILVFVQMSIIFNVSGLDDVDPPCVAQTFIDHNALLYKVSSILVRKVFKKPCFSIYWYS